MTGQLRNAALAASLAVACFAAQPALADEGGISFWLPGNFGSLAAAPGTPGWSWATVYYHTDVSSGAGQQFPRGGRVDVGISGLGGFRSRVAGVGPQVGFLFPVGGMQGYLNLKGYWEFAAQNRPEGWNTRVTSAISPAAPEPASAKPVVRKY
jgi:hypothetical protein